MLRMKMMKTTVIFWPKNKVVSYMQAYRATQDTVDDKAVTNEELFKLVAP
jgi:hypothetical protein